MGFGRSAEAVNWRERAMASLLHIRKGYAAEEHSNSNDSAIKVAATVGTLAGLALFANAVRKTEGFGFMKNTLSDTMESGSSFSLGTFACGASTLLLARLLRDEDPNCLINRIGTRGLELVGYAIAGVGITKWAFKEEHDSVAGVYFIGSPIVLSILALDEMRHKSKAAGIAAAVASAVGALSFVVGYDREKNSIPALFESTHAGAMSLWALGVSAKKFLIPMLRDRIGG